MFEPEEVLEPYSVLSKAASLSEEQEAHDARDDCLGHSEEKQGRLHSSAHFLCKGQLQKTKGSFSTFT